MNKRTAKHVIEVTRPVHGAVYVTTVRLGEVKTSIFHQYARQFATKVEAEAFIAKHNIQNARVVFFV